MAAQEVTREEIYERIRVFLVEQGAEEDEVVEAAYFNKDTKIGGPDDPNLGFDSLDLVEVVMALEDNFGLKIPDDDAQKLATVGQAVDYVYERREVIQLMEEQPTTDSSSADAGAAETANEADSQPA